VKRKRLYLASDFHRAVPVGRGGWRSPFRRDYARLIHSPAFRRLQGKTQLFAGLESDFFRNRLTHSLEVAQIAKSIAMRLNAEKLRGSGLQIDLDLMEFAGLAHDIGHPPFGHTGERILNQLMIEMGGFEGNAQSLRIIARLEKKLEAEAPDYYHADEKGRIHWFDEGEEVTIGLNLCSRTLASILKYDCPITYSIDDKLTSGSRSKPKKGYYQSEAEIVQRVKRDVSRKAHVDKFKTLECQIMDLADDIAYSTYDLEDAFKGRLLTPLDLLSADHELVEKVAERVNRETGESLDVPGVLKVLQATFPLLAKPLNDLSLSYRTSREFGERGFFRTTLTSFLVNDLVNAVNIKIDEENPALSGVSMAREPRIRMSILKQWVYVLLIESDRLRVVSYRGEKIIKAIFDALWQEKNYDLMPRDCQEKFLQAPDEKQARVVCDFIAGMTDRYAVEFYARLRSENFQTIFKPY